MKFLMLLSALVSFSAHASPYCSSENFAGPDCWGTPGYQQKGRGDTRNEDYTYCHVDSENWARGYFECTKADGRRVRARAPKYVPQCDGSERFGSTAWWYCQNNGN